MLASGTSNYFINSRPEVAALLPASCKNVLEIGCGEGRFAPNVKNRSSYWAVEPAPGAAERARTVIDKVLVGTYDDVAADLPDAFFDLVICNDVIEHMLDHDAFLKNVQAKLVPGAMMVGSIPNVRYLPHLLKVLRGRDWAYQDAGTLDRTHLRFFTAKSFARTVEEHGFVLDQLVGLNSVTHSKTLLGRIHWQAELLLLGLTTFSDPRDARYLQFGFRMQHRAGASS